MKKILPIFIVGILIFSGFGISIGTSHKMSISKKFQPDVKILDIIGGFFRVEATIRNVGDENAVIDRVTIVVDAPIMLLGRNTDITIPVGLGAGVTIAIVSDWVFGLGSCTIRYTLNIRYHKQVTATANGFIFGPYIHIKEFFPSM